jgi:hypothetical protein
VVLIILPTAATKITAKHKKCKLGLTGSVYRKMESSSEHGDETSTE